MKSKERNAELMGNESIPRLIMRFSFSTFAALIFNSLYTITDALFVSRFVGDDAMGGVSLILPFVVLQSAIATAVGGGAASVISRALGKGDFKAGGNAAYNAMLFFYGSAALITIVGFVFLEPTLQILGVTEELYESAKQYYIVILAGNIFSTGFSSIIRAEGKMTYALLIWVIPVSVNIILDAVFILALGWGVLGSAAATVICQMTSAAMSAVFFIKFSALDFSQRHISKKLLGEIILIGMPSVVQMGSLSLLTLIINNTLSLVAGTQGVNSFAYIGKIITFAVVPFTALSMALSPTVGYNYGNGNYDRVKKAFMFCLLFCLAYSLLATVTINIFSRQLVSIFTENESAIINAADGLKAVSYSLPFSFLPLLAACLFQAEGRKVLPLVLNSVTFVAAAVLMNFFGKRFSVSGVWAAYVASNIISSAVAFVAVVTKGKKENRSPKMLGDRF